MDFKADYAHLGNLSEMEESYKRFQKDPTLVDPSWRYFFEGLELGLSKEKGLDVGAFKESRICQLIQAYRTKGHLLAKINPLNLKASRKVPELELKSLGFSEDELKEPFPTLGLKKEPLAPLEEIIDVLKDIYCRTIGVEYKNLELPALESWLQEKIESTHFRPNYSKEKKQEILHELNKSSLFELFLHTRYVGQKRFSLEGGETLIPILHEIIENGAELGAQEFVIGMSHRGRLNVLANILNKSFAMIFSEFEGYIDPKAMTGTGDVKYHKGFSATFKTNKGHEVHISLTSNPSHLESVDPVVEGKVRAKQTLHKDTERKKIVPILIHGDASIAGQGVVYECMQLYNLEGYKTGGTIHLVVNNQIGFTTIPSDSRSTNYCTDLARAFSAPVFHVNAEDPEGCVYAATLACQIRQEFHSDVFIDMNCYRKYGHNEGDEPFFTQPLEYQEIKNKKPIREIYRDKLIEEGVIEKANIEKLEEEFAQNLHRVLEEVKIAKVPPAEEAFDGEWKTFKKATKEDLFAPFKSGVDKEILQKIAKTATQLPPGFTVHPKVEKLYEARLGMVEGDSSKLVIDWGCAEFLAFGSLLWEGVSIRLSGQDSRRGTFSQRHSAWIDQKNETRYYPLAHLKESQGDFEVIDSPLSEYAVLGFEFGYSLASPKTLVLWEAQYGDFANGGQIIIDQYISCSEQKWSRSSGLTILLPHGYEGQGPEHSSARLERFLQLAGNDNMQIVNATTPAQYFHLLRRQTLRSLRKPLILFTHKTLLRHPGCVSSLDDLMTGSFQEILDDVSVLKDKVTRILLCTGKVYYDLLQEKTKSGEAKIALIRIEELYPLQTEKLKKIIESYAKAQEIYWVQEEPINMGAWSTIHPLLLELFGATLKIKVSARKKSAAPAVGSGSIHLKEQEELIKKAFNFHE